jgi:hypothetical protein
VGPWPNANIKSRIGPATFNLQPAATPAGAVLAKSIKPIRFSQPNDKIGGLTGFLNGDETGSAVKG